MSANPAIKEGGVARQFTDIAKIQTPVIGGGTQYWVLETETKLVTKNISKNGTYKAKDDGAYGYNIVTVKVEPKLTTKNVSKNGTYKAKSDGADGFEIVNVNVPGGKGSSNNSGKPSGTDVTHTKPDGGLDLDDVTPPGGPGSSVVGTDPETGNDYAVGVDKDGNLVQTRVPSGIRVITPPTKTQYTLNEALDLSGLVVGLKNRDGSTFTDSRYSNGHIPMGELILPVQSATQSWIPVRWKSGYDGRLFADSFQISVGGIDEHLSDLRNWSATRNGSSWSPSIQYSNGVSTVTATVLPGWERFSYEVAVSRYTNYIFSLHLAPSNFISQGESRGWYPFIGVATQKPTADDFIGGASYMLATTRYSQAGGDYSVVFNSGANTKVWLMIDFGAIEDGTTATLVFSNIQFRETTVEDNGGEGAGHSF